MEWSQGGHKTVIRERCGPQNEAVGPFLFELLNSFSPNTSREDLDEVPVSWFGIRITEGAKELKRGEPVPEFMQAGTFLNYE